jgi:asparagine synthase (glutamine-hydrolysing)
VDGQVWAELSGGLDSSSIVCMADEIVKSGSVEASRLETVSLVFDEASQSDERNYIRYVEDRIGKAGHHLREDDFRMLASSAVEHPYVIPNPFGTFAEYNKALNQVMHEKAARVLLSGRGGDEIFNNIPDPTPELADLLVQWNLRLLHRRLKIWSETLRKPYIKLLWEHAVAPVLPQSLLFKVGRRRKMKILELYDQGFIRHLNLHRRSVGVPDVFGFRYPSGRNQSISFLSLVRMLSAGYWREWGNVETTYPFMHRPLIEFMQAIPSTQRLRPGETRSLMRRAVRDLLPLEIVNRKDKAFDTDATIRAVTRECLRLQSRLADARVSAYGYINAEALLIALNQAKKGSALSSLSIAFVISLEDWLRHFERRPFTPPEVLDVVAPCEGMAKAS